MKFRVIISSLQLLGLVAARHCCFCSETIAQIHGSWRILPIGVVGVADMEVWRYGGCCKEAVRHSKLD